MISLEESRSLFVPEVVLILLWDSPASISTKEFDRPTLLLILTPESPIAVSGLSGDDIAGGVPHFILAFPSRPPKIQIVFLYYYYKYRNTVCILGGRDGKASIKCRDISDVVHILLWDDPRMKQRE
jgi:hypothetical protein